MKRDLAGVERTATGYSAYSPHLPGCISTGPARAAIETNMREAIHFHGLPIEGLPIPEPGSESAYIHVAA